jgi:tellurite resistance protein
MRLGAARTASVTIVRLLQSVTHALLITYRNPPVGAASWIEPIPPHTWSATVPPKSPIPASFFGMVLGIVGLGSAWRAASALWGIPGAIGEMIMITGAAVWAILMIGYGLKWLLQRDEALAELRHPIQCCFISLVPATTTLMGLVLAPHHRLGALALWLVGTLSQVAFSAFRSGGLWRGGADLSSVTPILFLPSVAANLISSIVAGALGLPSWGLLFFGMGFFSWVVIESAIVLRLWTAAPLPPSLRPALGIHMAPPVVASVAYLANTNGLSDAFVQAMWGYGLFQLGMLARLLPWVGEQPFSASYWGYSFGITAISTGALQISARGGSDAIANLAPLVFVLSNAAMATLLVGTLIRLFQRRLVPPPLTGIQATK